MSQSRRTGGLGRRLRICMVLLFCAVLLGWPGGTQNDSYFHTGETCSITLAHAVTPRLSKKDWERLLPGGLRPQIQRHLRLRPGVPQQLLFDRVG